uniref:Dimer_Tnp_hAT domain-containing protein n=1 Tax=Steinernema glaseri TaxID=37863 RepID=A0A1I7Y4N2_9BILA
MLSRASTFSNGIVAPPSHPLHSRGTRRWVRRNYDVACVSQREGSDQLMEVGRRRRCGEVLPVATVIDMARFFDKTVLEEDYYYGQLFNSDEAIVSQKENVKEGKTPLIFWKDHKANVDVVMTIFVLAALELLGSTPFGCLPKNGRSTANTSYTYVFLLQFMGIKI